jgi:hypothetical protein
MGQIACRFARVEPEPRPAITGGKPRIRHEDHDLRLEYYCSCRQRRARVSDQRRLLVNFPSVEPACESAALYDLIENEVAPRFYDYDHDGVPTR